jgi:hypothetical protein
MKTITLVELCPAVFESQIMLIETIDELLDVETAEESFWPKIIQFMIEHNTSSLSATTAEIIDFIKECKPVGFKFQVASSIHKPEEEFDISNEEFDEMITNGIPIPEGKNDPNKKGWDLDIIMYFDAEDIKKMTIPKAIQNGFDALEGAYGDDICIDAFVLKNVSLKEIITTLIPLNVEIDDL